MKLNIPHVKPRKIITCSYDSFWQKGDKSRLPEFFKRHWFDMNTREEKAIHYIKDERKWIVDHENGKWKRVKQPPIPIMYPHQSNQGLWGGEGIIAGYYITTNPRLDPHAKLWNPTFMKFIFYSELLNKHFAIVVTRTTIEQIEQSEGFDEYILNTHPFDLKSDFGMTLKREMLHLLCDKSQIRPDNLELQTELYERYKKYAIPKEQIDWLGLSLVDALKKMYKNEEKEYEEQIRPWKDIYKEKLELELSPVENLNKQI